MKLMNTTYNKGMWILLALVFLTGCELMLDEHAKVSVDFCAQYKGEDECCANDDPCDLAGNGACNCLGCDWDHDECTMTWSFTDVCNDGASVQVGIYQVGQNGTFERDQEESWEDLELNGYGVQGSVDIDCEAGLLLCYGGWADVSGWNWGCSQDCQTYCDSCCYQCDYSEEVTLELGCN